MTYIEAEQFIRKSYDKEIRLGLERITELLAILKNPQKELKFIHVAGTNGKGSVCAMTAEILKRAGYITGLFTSPVISDYREQFRLDGDMITKEDFARLADAVKKACEQLPEPPSEFEKAVALAFLYFKECNCDFVVLEVGMGGMDDATNVIGTPEVAAVVNIDYDHMSFLGNTLKEIAEKKAGIIKETGTVVIAAQNKSVEKLLVDTCIRKNARFVVTSVAELKIKQKSVRGQIFDYRNYKGLELSLLGDHQCENAAVVLEIVGCLIAKGYDIPEEAVFAGMKNVHWTGRFEVMRTDPVFIVDGAHNPNGISVLKTNLSEYFPNRKFVFITGILRDKDYNEMLQQMIPLAESFITIEPDNSRAMSAHQCANAIRACGFTGEILESMDTEQAVLTGCQRAKTKKLPVCVFGSLYSVGRINLALGKEE